MSKANNILVSIIIPVYNTPRDFFENCIESIVCTECNSYEIILVDDGSEEENSLFYKKFSSKYEKIVYLKKENGGVSSARNKGIITARGKYIAFVDADDVIAPNFLSEVIEIAGEYDCDIIIGSISCDVTIMIPQTKKELVFLPKEKIKSLKKRFLQIPQPDIPYGVSGSPCAKLYKKNIVEQIMFSEQMTHSEDQLFNRKIFDIVESAVVVPNCWYIYNQNDFSAMHNMKPGEYLKKLIPFFEEWERLNVEEEDKKIRTGARAGSILLFFVAVNDIVSDGSLSSVEQIKKLRDLYSYSIFANLVKEPPEKENISRYERFRLFLIRKKMVYAIYMFVYIRRKVRKFVGTL